MNRRKFLAGATALFCAPAIVRADSLMNIVPNATRIIGIDFAAPGTETTVVALRRSVWVPIGDKEFVYTLEDMDSGREYHFVWDDDSKWAEISL